MDDRNKGWLNPAEGRHCVNCNAYYAPGKIPDFSRCRKCGESVSVKKPFPWWIVILGFFALIVLFGHK